MSLSLRRRQRPTSLQIIPTYGAFDSDEAADEAAVELFKTSSPVPVTTTLASSPTRSTSPINRTTPTTKNTTGRPESPKQTTFVTIVITRSSSEEEESETPPATKTVFFSVTPQSVTRTISAVPSTTTVAGNLQGQDGQGRHKNGPTLTRTAKIFLSVLGAISGVAVIVSIGLVVWKKKKNKRRKKSIVHNSNTPEIRERENPFLDPPERQRYG